MLWNLKYLHTLSKHIIYTEPFGVWGTDVYLVSNQENNLRVDRGECVVYNMTQEDIA